MRALDASADALQLLERILDRLPLMVHYTSPDGSTRRVNREFERMLGCPTACPNLESEPEGSWREVKIQALSGALIDTSWVHVTLPDGTVVAMGRDVSKRKRTEFYFAESQRLSKVGSWAWSPKTREPSFWSRQLYAIFGFDPDDPAMGPHVAHANTRARVHPEDWERLEHAIGSAARAKRGFEVDYRIVLPDGTLKYVRGIGNAIVSDSGELVELIGSVMDITEGTKAEERLRALARRHESVREDERKRVAREIHDELGQALTAIKLDISHIKHHLSGEPGERCESILRNVDDTIKAVRRIATELRPGILDDLGLLAAVEWATEEFQNRTGIKCKVTLPPCVAAIDQERATAIFRILQETLTNVTRHARATRVDVLLMNQDGIIMLRVADNGIGVCEEQLPAGGSFGIQGMRERALLLGGEFEICGVRDAGTTVTVRIPIGTASGELN